MNIIHILMSGMTRYWGNICNGVYSLPQKKKDENKKKSDFPANLFLGDAATLKNNGGRRFTSRHASSSDLLLFQVFFSFFFFCESSYIWLAIKPVLPPLDA